MMHLSVGGKIARPVGGGGGDFSITGGGGLLTIGGGGLHARFTCSTLSAPVCCCPMTRISLTELHLGSSRCDHPRTARHVSQLSPT